MLRLRLRGVLMASTLFLAAGMTRGAEPSQIPVWPEKPPGVIEIPGEEREEPLRPNDSTIRVTNVSRPTLTVYRAPAEKNTGAAVLICPGGGYSILAWNKEGTEVAEWLNSIGVTGVVLKYRVPARTPESRLAPLYDAQRAMGLIRQHAAEWGVQPNKVGVLGFSAGGHLAARLSTDHATRGYPALDDADKLPCRPDFALLIYPAYLVAGKGSHELAPELKVSGDTPRTFLLQTQDDGVQVECSLFYYLALKTAKVPSELHVYPNGGHGYGLRPSIDAVSTWPQRAETWLKTLLK